MVVTEGDFYYWHGVPVNSGRAAILLYPAGRDLLASVKRMKNFRGKKMEKFNGRCLRI